MTEDWFGRDQFEYIWCNIHLDCKPDPGNKQVNADVNEDNDGSIVPEEEEEDDNKDDEEDLTEDEKLKKEREQRIKDTYVSTASDDEEDSPIDYNTDQNNNDGRDIELWYQRAKLFLNQVNKFSRTYCKHPGFALSIDEMMKLFKGWSKQTYCMKKKPIKEGYKFFALCKACTGFVYYFMPLGLNEKKKGPLLIV